MQELIPLAEEPVEGEDTAGVSVEADGPLEAGASEEPLTGEISVDTGGSLEAGAASQVALIGHKGAEAYINWRVRRLN